MTDRPFEADREVAVSGVVLAAGTSSRFGEANKLLATVDGTALVRHAVETVLAADLHEVVVVVGYEADAVRDRIDDLPVEVVENDAYADGQATSVRRGIAALSDATDAALFALGDMPHVRAETVETLVAAFEGQRGNPALFGRQFFDDLAAVDGDTGGREILLGAEGTRLVETGDPGVLRDVDRPEDL